MKDRIYHVKINGCVVVNGIETLVETSKLIAIEIDLKTKWAETGGIMNGNELFLGGGDRTIHLRKNKNKDQETLICFPKYADFDIFTAEVSRYTLRVCLKRKQKT